MSDYSHEYKPLLMALAFSCIATTANPVNAMSFPNAQMQEAKISAKKDAEKKEDAAVPIEPQSTVLPDGLNTIIDTLENPQDVKHYSFTAVRGQKVMVHHIPQTPGKSPWKIEYNIDQHWRVIPHNSSYISAPLTPQQQVQIKVSREPTRVLQPGEHYEIEFGSAPYLTKSKVSGDADRYAIRFGVHKFVKKVDWTTIVADSTQHPLEGVTVSLEFVADETSPSDLIISQRTSNPSGFISTTFNLNACIGKHTTLPFVGVYDFKTKWRLTYNTGYWFMSPRGNDAGGVGSRNDLKVRLVHICTQKIVR